MLHKYLRQNKIKLNGKKQPLNTRLTAGDLVRLYLPPEAESAPPPPAPLEVLWEDNGLLALYKPAGLITLVEGRTGEMHSRITPEPPPVAAPGGGVFWSEPRAKDALTRRLRTAEHVSGGTPRSTAPRPEPDSLLARARLYTAGAFEPLACHRLDTGTSGIVLFAKNPAMLDFVTGLIRDHQLQKTYYGLCFGHPQPPEGMLSGWLSKDAAAARVRVTPRKTAGAKPVETAYRTIATDGPLALVELHPKTGRTHQLRAQLAAAGAPLLGDSKYGDLAANRRYRCRYQCLCAAALRFPALDAAGPFAAYSRLAIRCDKPWFYGKLLEGGFEHSQNTTE
ncbi:RluA family pseudouridine synthase [Ruminococcaceae bacterium OttesenSCG-928-D13]|nr:RluA family pseudouridine synthase [Ruminococcaceae bacterium OttesenSCG-928-D13]